MIEVIPVVLRLELKPGAPAVNFVLDSVDKKLPIRRRTSKSSSFTMFPRKNKLPRPSATLGEDEASSQVSIDARPTQGQCQGRRTYSEVVVETYGLEDRSTPALTVQPSTSRSSVRSKTSPLETSVDALNFFSGNPSVEKTSGILHFYKNKSPHEILRDNCWTLCMLEVPVYVSCTELIKFISSSAKTITETKIIRDGMPNQYYVLIKFKSSEGAFDFYEEYNGSLFNAFESARCNLLFVERMEMTPEGGSLPVEGLTELPMCAVCLERMDDGVLTILCNHSFHAECLQHWEDTTCPVCRFNQTPELLPDQTCSECGKTQDLWMCLICGHIGCGRYAEAHAYRHFETTSHTFTLQLGGNLVWDYAGDNYVHRLIQSSTDGKMVEYQGSEDQKGSEKMNAIQLEYSCLLSRQLEDQRLYFEGKIKEMEDRFLDYKEASTDKITTLQEAIQHDALKLEGVQMEVDNLKTEKQHLEKKCTKSAQIIKKLQTELTEEKQMNSLVSTDKKELVEKNKELQKQRTEEIKNLQDQINDLMMHFTFQSKLNDSNISQSELNDSEVGLIEGKKPTTSRRSKQNKRI